MIRTQAELTALQIPKWFFPTFHGDIRLVATSEESCDLVMSKLSPDEEKAIVMLAAIVEKKKWSSSLLKPAEGTASLSAPIDKVAKQLQKLLKPARTMITAVLFADGAMAEVRGPMDLPDSLAPASDGPTPPTTDREPAGETEVLPKTRREPVAAATVAAPTRGCPAPDFTKADLKAKDVLRTFLTSDQVADFNRYNKFVDRGQTTGNHYMITSRHAKDELAKYTRTLYDLDRRIPLCVHDWDVPAAEEMLTLHVLLQLPGWERYLDVSEDNLERVLAEFLDDNDKLMPVVHGPFFGDDGVELDLDGAPAGHPRFTVSPAVRAAAQRGLI